MALTDVELVNLSIGNTPSNPYYPILSNREVQSILDSVDGDVHLATRKAANNASFVIISIPNREKIGDIEMWNEYSKNYLMALRNILEDNSYTLPNGLMPYAGGIHSEDYCKTEMDRNRNQSKIAGVVRTTRRKVGW